MSDVNDNPSAYCDHGFYLPDNCDGCELETLRAQVSTLTLRLAGVEAETLERARIAAVKELCGLESCGDPMCEGVRVSYVIRSLASKKGTDNAK